MTTSRTEDMKMTTRVLDLPIGNGPAAVALLRRLGWTPDKMLDLSLSFAATFETFTVNDLADLLGTTGSRVTIRLYSAMNRALGGGATGPLEHVGWRTPEGTLIPRTPGPFVGYTGNHAVFRVRKLP